MSDEFKINVLEEKENKLLERKEVKLEIVHEGRGTPSKQEVFSILSSRYSVPEEFIIIDYIFTKKGLQASLVKAKIYQRKVREKVEKEKEEAKEEKPKEEKPKEKGGEEKREVEKIEKEGEKNNETQIGKNE